jgi:hypothetical protein
LVARVPRAVPDAGSITAFAKEEFVSAAWDVVGKKVSKARLLADIYDRRLFHRLAVETRQPGHCDVPHDGC